MSPDAPGPDTVPAIVASAVERFGDRPAVVEDGSRITYAELADRARAFGSALVASGVERGDRVAVWAFNCTEWIVAFLGLSGAGAVLVPVNTRFKGTEAADILARSRARVLVTVTDFLGTDYVAMLTTAGTELPDLETVLVARGPVPGGTVGWEAFVARDTPDGRAEVATAVGRRRPRPTRATSSSPPGPPGRPRAWSRPTVAPPGWPPTGWP